MLVGAVSPVVIRESSEYTGTVYYGCSTTTTNTCTCSNGAAVTGTACTSNGASICATCDNEFYKTGSSCTTCRSACGTGTKETTACSSAANRVCTTIVEESTTTLTWKIPMTPQDQPLSDGSYDFVWTGAHNVYKFKDKQAYNTCDFTSAVLIGDVSPVMIRESPEFTGTVYYGCELSGHCDAGQKVAITIGTDTRTTDENNGESGESGESGDRGDSGDSGDSNGKDTKLSALVLSSFFSVSGIDRTDLLDGGETQQKLAEAISNTIGVRSAGRVTITAITDWSNRRRLLSGVLVNYQVVVYNKDEQIRDATYVEQIKTKMETLDKDSEGLKNIIATQVGIDSSAIDIGTPGKVISSNNDINNGNAMQAQDVNEGTGSATSSNAWWISLVVIAFLVLTATVVVLLVKKKSYLRFDDEESQGKANQTSSKGVAIAMVTETEMTNITKRGGAKINENDSSFENPLQAVQVVKAKNTSLFDSAAAAPPKERTAESRHKNRRISKKNSLPTPSAPYVASTFSKGIVTTEMGKGILMYERPEDQCRVFKLEWKLAGDSKAVLYSFKK